MYDIFLEKPGNEIISRSAAFEIVTGVPSNLSVNVTSPPSARANRVTSFLVEFANLGNTDIMNPKVTIQSQTDAPLALSVSELSSLFSILVIPCEELNGPLGILRPGVAGSITIYTKTTTGLGFIVKY